MTRSIFLFVVILFLAALEPFALTVHASPDPTRSTFTIDMRHPENRMFQVTATFPGRPDSSTVLRLPVWSPGSYLIREYAKNIPRVEAQDANGTLLRVEKTAKDRWDVEHEPGATIVVSYQVYGGELTVRTPYLTSNRASWQHTSLFVSPVDDWDARFAIEVLLPEGWEADMLLDRDPASANRWRGEGLRQFYDTVGIAGPLVTWEFEVGGRPHRLVFDGVGNYDRETLLPLVIATLEEGEQLFRGEEPMLEDGTSPALPLPEYAILVSLGDGGGGLEHDRGTHLTWYRWGFATEKDRIRFTTLCAHEYFHLWNVRRIAPEPLVDPDYQAENYVRSLFEVEGVASYYDILLPGRALARLGSEEGRKVFLELFEREVRQHLETPGRRVQTLRESSFDTWIKFYRKDENSANTTISYYRKGCLVAFMMDSHIREQTNDSHDLDDVWRELWRVYRTEGVGYDDYSGMQDAALHATGVDLSGMYERYVYGLEPLPLEQWVNRVGLELGSPDSVAWLGAKLRHSGSRIYLETVFSGGPADAAGLSNGDELLAIDGWRVAGAGANKVESLEDRMSALRPGQSVAVTVSREGKLLETTLLLSANEATRSLRYMETPTGKQAEAFRAWCGFTHPNAE